MIIFNLIKLLLAIAFFYFLLVMVRMLFYIGKNSARREDNKASSQKDQYQYKKNEHGQTIELNKDQYKVE